MTTTLNNQAITLSAYCVNDEDALVLCGTTTDWVYVGRGGREDDDGGEKYAPVCANCGDRLD